MHFRLGLFEEVVKGHLRPCDGCMSVAGKPIGCHKCQVQSVFRLRLAAKGFHLVSQVRFVSCGYLVFSSGKLHFAEVCHPIAALDDQVYLRTAFIAVGMFNPCRFFRGDAGYPQRGFDLPRMLEADAFEGETFPDDAALVLPHVRPVGVVLPRIIAYELTVEQRVVVKQLVY